MQNLQDLQEHREHLQLKLKISLPDWLTPSPEPCISVHTCFSVFPVFRVFLPYENPGNTAVFLRCSQVFRRCSRLAGQVRAALGNTSGTPRNTGRTPRCSSTSHREEHRGTPRTPVSSHELSERAKS